MVGSEKKLKRVASEASHIRSMTALARAKRSARAELKRIFDEEVEQRKSERQHSLSRPATASHSQS
jgi:hypothetical protein